jgi:hypothetical protein
MGKAVLVLGGTRALVNNLGPRNPAEVEMDRLVMLDFLSLIQRGGSQTDPSQQLPLFQAFEKQDRSGSGRQSAGP